MHDHITERIEGASHVSVGRFTYGSERLALRQWGEGSALNIGAFCSLAENITVFLGGNHRIDWITTYPFGLIRPDLYSGTTTKVWSSTNGDVVIGNDVWIGHGVTIMSGVQIGDGAVIAANACVTKDVAPYHVVGGNPAVKIKQRFEDDIIDLLLQLSWWDLPTDDIKVISTKLCAVPDKTVLQELVTEYRT